VAVSYEVNYYDVAGKTIDIFYHISAVIPNSLTVISQAAKKLLSKNLGHFSENKHTIDRAS